MWKTITKHRGTCWPSMKDSSWNCEITRSWSTISGLIGHPLPPCVSPPLPTLSPSYPCTVMCNVWHRRQQKLASEWSCAAYLQTPTVHLPVPSSLIKLWLRLVPGVCDICPTVNVPMSNGGYLRDASFWKLLQDPWPFMDTAAKSL